MFDLSAKLPVADDLKIGLGFGDLGFKLLPLVKSVVHTIPHLDRLQPLTAIGRSKAQRDPVRTKLMIIVSDGYPQDEDYGPDRADNEYGLQDTARALREAEQAGISTFCITIDPAGHDYLRRMCPEQHYLVIDDVTALPGELAKVYRALTASSRVAVG